MFDLISWLPKVNNSCFLDCDYCMVKREMITEKKGQLPTTMMDLSLVSEMCEKSIGYNRWFFSILGGEPLMNGKQYFRDMFELIDQKSKKYHVPYSLRVTTNGLLLDDEWIELLAEYNCKIVFSYDGFGIGGKGSRKAQDILRKYAPHVHNVMTVISNDNCDQLVKIYDELASLGIRRFSTQYEIYSSVEDYKHFGKCTVEVFKHIESLDLKKLSYFVYNDAKSLSKGKMSLNSGDFLNNRLVGDYVVDYDGTMRNGLSERDSTYGVYGKLQDFNHANDILFTDTMKTVLRDYVTAIHCLDPRLKDISLLTRGGGYPGDRFGIRPEAAPHMPKLECYKILLDYFNTSK